MIILHGDNVLVAGLTGVSPDNPRGRFVQPGGCSDTCFWWTSPSICPHRPQKPPLTHRSLTRRKSTLRSQFHGCSVIYHPPKTVTVSRRCRRTRAADTEEAKAWDSFHVLLLRFTFLAMFLCYVHYLITYFSRIISIYFIYITLPNHYIESYLKNDSLKDITEIKTIDIALPF